MKVVAFSFPLVILLHFVIVTLFFVIVVVIGNSTNRQLAHDLGLRLVETLRYQSSDIDWCEPNYVFSRHIVEFFNTLSNVLFFTWPPLLLFLYRSYAAAFGWGSTIVWILLIVVGFGSTFFHATLSYFGQLWDEISILWVISAAVGAWPPKEFIEERLRFSTSNFRWLLFCFVVVTSGLSFLKPTLNAPLLFLYGSVCSLTVRDGARRSRDWKVKAFTRRTFLIFGVALTCWLLDRLACQLCLLLSFPYFHAVWHLLILVCSVNGCVLLSYYAAARATWVGPRPRLLWWPGRKTMPGIVPFVAMETTTATAEDVEIGGAPFAGGSEEFV